MRLTIVSAAATALLLLAGGCAAEAPRPGAGGATSPSASPSTSSRDSRGAPVFDGVTVGIDPGHNGGNAEHPEVMTRQVWDGRTYKDCNTTGTSTDAGYPESRYTFRVAQQLARQLRREGARVVMTRHDDHGVGPCVDQRARIINRAGADVAVDIHADGSVPSARGFAVLVPVRSKANAEVVGSSRRYARILRDSFRRTGMPVSDYLGADGLQERDDLAGLNLTTVPQVLIESGNMRNPQDARLLTSPAFQQRAATRIRIAMARFLEAGAGQS